MQGQNPIQVQALILCEIPEVVMHRFVDKTKSFLTSGTCKIAKLEQKDSTVVYFINLNTFYYTLHKDTVFIRIIYEETTSFLFPHFDNGMCALTVLSSSIFLNNLQQVFRNAAILVDFDTVMMDPSLRIKIEQHCSQVQKQPIYYPDNVKKMIKTTGSYLNNAFITMGSYFKKGIEKVGGYANKQMQGTQRTQIKQQTKQTWQKIKYGTNQFLKISSQYANKIINPVIKKGKQYKDDINEKIDKSDNKNIKYAKELAQTSTKALGQAFDGLVQGTTFVGKEITEQSKKLINKKFGDKPEERQKEEQIELEKGQKMNDKVQKESNKKENNEKDEQKTMLLKKEETNEDQTDIKQDGPKINTHLDVEYYKIQDEPKINTDLDVKYNEIQYPKLDDKENKDS